MTNKALVLSQCDTETMLETVINSPNAIPAVLGFTMCILTGIIGICYLASQGCSVSLSIGDTKLQAGPCSEEVL